MSTLGISIFMGFYYWFSRLRLGYTFSSMLLQPVVIGVFVGLITENMVLAMQIGAALQLVYLGVTSTPGGNVPSDPALAGCIAIPLGVLANIEPQVAIAFAIPFGVLGVFVDQLRRTTNAIWVHMADDYATQANTKGIMRCAFIYPALMGWIIRFPVVFAIVYYGVEAVEKLMKIIPEWLMHSFEIMGGILPALGFAITLTVIGKNKLIPFFIIGFFAVAYLGLPTMAVAIIGTCIALLLNLFTLKDEVA
ncbi:PTS sugar transporter subunit IIC [Schnuerera sp. xch1]|uniref:PTS mannose/fructose/sorbose/N-acetylgalactosamine transporter subunit IIC n=1 Tax=Schnuerera sp. xch1 TaxID=2874283 RepID=UPI001CBF6F82|nr:PTS sugar transporter subunit IIC [Schnuerera sp. xch1]MBZ2175995.1 PTS sugar transporter subunit IIC [Schnuerera sp. xch1]